MEGFNLEDLEEPHFKPATLICSVKAIFPNQDIVKSLPGGHYSNSPRRMTTIREARCLGFK